ncbi:DNA polymerase delta subunit 4-like [Neltuma alba]|uniref:DNA polymerase delta subunit 4-like n=1 Tax=Neltuma alba TaxID=207710 RepID=UPI0010A4BCF2|nr:DNA polymerase delta subunit 4-like [Prosopis alba]
MASASGSMKGFYRQRKAHKSSSKSSKKSVSLAPDVAQAPSPKDDVNEHEEMLRQFDMNMAYGPCIGITRLARWERAHKLGLNPPAEIEKLLKGEKVQADCLWDGRI